MAAEHFHPTQTNSLTLSHMRVYNTAKNRKVSLPRHRSLLGRVERRNVKTHAMELAFQFGKRTSIHGMDRLFGESSSCCERLIWLVAVILAFMCSIYVSLILSRRFKEGKFQTVIEDYRIPVYTIPFPVITICNLNRLNWHRLEEAKRIFLRENYSPQEEQVFEDVVSGYDHISFGEFSQFSKLKGQPLQLVKNVNFTDVVKFMTWRCEELLHDCSWNVSPTNCCQLFLRRRSEFGVCWGFNTLESDQGRERKFNDSLYPWHISGNGPRSGLTLKAYIHPELHRPDSKSQKGISLMVSEPNVWHITPFEVPQNTKTIVDIEPIIYYHDVGTRSVPSSQRQCVFVDERSSRNFKTLNGYLYMNENCQAQCHQEYLMQHCNCSLDILYPPSPYPPCRAKDLLCLAENNNFFRHVHQKGEEHYVRSEYRGMHCNCLSNCHALYYVTDVRPTYMPSHDRNNESYIDLDIHFRFSEMMVYRTSLVFGWLDLIVAFGGIAGLFLGCSLISAIELVYFTIIDLPKFIVDKCKQQFKGGASTDRKASTFLNVPISPRTIEEHHLRQLNDAFFRDNTFERKIHGIHTINGIQRTI